MGRTKRGAKINPRTTYDPAYFLPGSGLRAYFALLAAQFRNYRRRRTLRRGLCPDCRVPLEAASLTPVLSGSACPSGHCFIGRRIPFPKDE